MNSNSTNLRAGNTARRSLVTPACTLMALVVGASLLVPMTANAADYLVTNGGDVPAAGQLTLREAVTAANATQAEDNIIFNGPVNVILLTQGELLVNSAATAGKLNINVPGNPAQNIVQIGSNGNGRVFNLDTGANVAMNRLVITGGRLNGTVANSLSGAGILNKGTLAIENSRVDNNGATNTVTTGAGAANAVTGGGISNVGGGNLTLTDSTVINNGVGNGGAAQGTGATQGGGIFNGDGSTATLIRSTVSGNAARGINQNPAEGNQGGGIFNAGTMTINTSTIAQNAADGAAALITVINRGGGIFNARGSLALNNSTVGLNTVVGPDTGAGINSTTTLTLNNTIVAGNTNAPNPAPPAGTVIEANLSGAFSGNFNVTTGTAQSVFGGNTLANNGGPTQTIALAPGAVAAGSPLPVPNPAVNMGDPSFNGVGQFDQRGPGFPRVVGGRLDIGAYESPFRPPVADNQNVTANAPLTAGGPPVSTTITLTGNEPDAGETDTFAIVTQPTKGTLAPVTQVAAGGGTPRTATVAYTPNAGASGIDTFTFQITDSTGLRSNIATVTITINDQASLVVTTDTDVTSTTDGRTTLREAIVTANTDGINSVITFDPVFFATARTITLANPSPAGTVGAAAPGDPLTTQLTLLSTNGNITITGPAAGVTISGNNAGRVFRNSAPNATITSVTITGGNQANNTVPPGSPPGTVPINVGGGILNEGTLALNNVTVSNNSATTSGGGIGNTGTLTVTNSRFTGNRAASNNGIGGAINNTGALTVAGTTFTGNQSTQGGAIASTTSLTVNNSTFSGNTVTGNTTGGTLPNSINRSDGGAIFTSASLNLINSTLTGNIASGSGGAVSSTAGITLNSSTIVGNTAGVVGGAISNAAVALNANNSIIVDNSAPTSPNFTNASVVSTNNSNITTGTAADAGLDPAGLKDNGGQVQTIALTTRGTAVNKGDNAAAAGLTTDGRGPGFPRIVGPRVDIGAFESAFGNRAPVVNNETFSTSINVPFSAQIFATDDDGDTLTFSRSSAANTLPAGITISSTGLISGTPTQAGRFDFQVNVFDGSNVTTARFILIVSTNADGVGPVVNGPTFNDNYTRDQLASIVYTGTVTDVAPTGVTPSGVDRVLFQLRRTSDGFAFSGDEATGFTSNVNIGYFPAFVDVPVPNTTAGTRNFRRTFGANGFIPSANVLKPGAYSIVIAAKDVAGNFSVEVFPFNVIAAPGSVTAPSAAKAKTSGGAS